MKPLTKDARGFVDGVLSYLKSEGKSSAATGRVQTMLSKMSASAKNQKTARVTSAVALTSAERGSIERMLGRLMGHSVALDCQVSRDILGGLRIEVGDWVLDTSLKGQLLEMHSLLTQQ